MVMGPTWKVQISFERCLFTQTMVYPCHGILLSNEKEPTTDTCNNLDGSQRHYAEKSHTQKVPYCMILWIEKSKTDYKNGNVLVGLGVKEEVGRKRMECLDSIREWQWNNSVSWLTRIYT